VARPSSTLDLHRPIFDIIVQPWEALPDFAIAHQPQQDHKHSLEADPMPATTIDKYLS
jgi:hypothetical protein